MGKPRARARARAGPGRALEGRDNPFRVKTARKKLKRVNKKGRWDLEALDREFSEARAEMEAKETTAQNTGGPPTDGAEMKAAKKTVTDTRALKDSLCDVISSLTSLTPSSSS